MGVKIHLVEISMHFKELRGILEILQILSPKIVVWQWVGEDSWKSGDKFPKKSFRRVPKEFQNLRAHADTKPPPPTPQEILQTL